MIFRVFAAAVMALIAGSIVERARADQSFICADGSLVQVKSGDLARMKRENACVASYFGGQSSAAPIPLPVRKPTRVGMRMQRAEPEVRSTRQSTYRVVRIINAGDGEPKWHHHRR